MTVQRETIYRIGQYTVLHTAVVSRNEGWGSGLTLRNPATGDRVVLAEEDLRDLIEVAQELGVAPTVRMKEESGGPTPESRDDIDIQVRGYFGEHLRYASSNTEDPGLVVVEGDKVVTVDLESSYPDYNYTAAIAFFEEVLADLRIWNARRA